MSLCAIQVALWYKHDSTSLQLEQTSSFTLTLLSFSLLTLTLGHKLGKVHFLFCCAGEINVRSNIRCSIEYYSRVLLSETVMATILLHAFFLLQHTWSCPLYTISNKRHSRQKCNFTVLLGKHQIEVCNTHLQVWAPTPVHPRAGTYHGKAGQRKKCHLSPPSTTTGTCKYTHIL